MDVGVLEDHLAFGALHDFELWLVFFLLFIVLVAHLAIFIMY